MLINLHIISLVFLAMSIACYCVSKNLLGGKTMDNDYDYQEVSFVKFCPMCEFEKLDGNEMPCDECLSEPTNLYSERPTKFKEKE